MLLTLRVIHILSAAALLGAILFNYFLLRPSLRLIPPAHAVVIAQRVGTSFTILGLTALSLLFASGVLRLYFAGLLDQTLTWEFYLSPFGRWLAVMVFGWLVTTVSASIMTIALRPTLVRKLDPTANPTLSDVEARRTAQLLASGWLDRLQLVNLAGSTLALLAGASTMFGGFF